MSSLFKKSVDRVVPEGKSTRYYSSLQEKAVAKATKGKTVVNSGATAFVKGDVLSGDDWLIECKTKVKDSESITVKKEWFTKNQQEMAFMDKDYSAVVISFGPNQPNYYIIDELTFQELLDYQKGNK